MAATLDWFGCATFRLCVDDLVVFLDAYIDRVPGAPGTGLRADDIDRADWIVVGHSHFDHVWGAERIALRTGATVVGSYETIRVMRAAGVPATQLMPVSGGERVRLSHRVTVSVFPSLHSCVWSHRGMAPADEVCLGDLGLSHQERQARFADLADFLTTLGPETLEHLRASNQGALGDGGPLLYLFETPHGSLLYQDTSGCWTGILAGLRPDVAILAAAGRANLDGEPIQGSLAEFVGRQTGLVEPRQLVLAHHDDWLPGFSTPLDVVPIRRAVEAHAGGTELLELGYCDARDLFAR